MSSDEQRIAALLRAVEAPAPPALHQRIAEISAQRRPSGMRGRIRRRLPSGTGWRAPGPALAGAFAAAAVAIAVLVASTGTTPPTALSAARLALAGATGPAPRSLIAAGTSIPFPRWSAQGWPNVGTRSDHIGGRIVTTEFYGSYEAADTIGYAIVSGPPLSWGASGREVSRSGLEYRMMAVPGAHVVSWVQAGHTCVLASRRAPAAILLALAVAQDPGSRV